ncbi:MAG: helix-turn-helix transcriptional regulator [Candidatus Krumholzibacteriota bacterium]|nr:helix-turn-helix transcriptional regulator [Candidatus Krumholzibacteriota bacterium]
MSAFAGLVLLLPLAMGLAAALVAGQALRTGRPAFVRAYLLDILLHNLLVIAGLAWYAGTSHLAGDSPAFTVLIIGLTALKLAWLLTLWALARLTHMVRLGNAWRRGAWITGALLAAIAALVSIGPHAGHQALVAATLQIFEFALFGAAVLILVLALARLRSLPRAAGRNAFQALMGIHLAFLVLATFVLGLALALGAAEGGRLPVAEALAMAGFNLLLLDWARRHGGRLPGPRAEIGAGAIDPGFAARHGISPREMEVVSLVCQGLTNQEIADRLFISLQTVKDHNHAVFRKAGVRNRVELINRARGEG